MPPKAGGCIQSGIYMIRNMVNNKCYIGQSKNVDRRLKEHMSKLKRGSHPNTHLQYAYNKYGPEAFDAFLLEPCSIDSLNSEEQRFIAAYHSNNPEYGYNMTAGGEGGREVSPEVTARRIESLHRYIEEHPEYIELRRQILAEPEVHQKIVNAMHTEEYRKKMSAVKTGFHHSEETKQKLAEINSKPVLCVETGVIYPSAKAATQSLPGKEMVRRAACGLRKTAGGFHWQYI